MKLLKFYSTWCGQCKALSTEFKNHPINVPIEEIDIEEHEDLVEKYKVKSLPTTILIDGENIIKTWKGVVKSSIINSEIENYANN